MSESDRTRREFTLNDGRSVPNIALGTYLGFNQDGIIKPKDGDVSTAIQWAIDVGYRHIDTASIYETESEIGKAIRTKIEDGTIQREDIFVTTKLWNTKHTFGDVEVALKNSLAELQLEYVDAYLMHWPVALKEDYSFSDVDYLETWSAMESVQFKGLTKTIGLSNFNISQIKRILNNSKIKPALLQIEVNPSIVQEELVKFAQDNDIVVMGYTPFGSIIPSRSTPGAPQPRIDDPILLEIAHKYNKTVPQIILRWILDREIIPIPKSTNMQRIKENIDIFDFKLTNVEILQINSFDKNYRLTRPSFWQEHPYYPFEKIDDPIANPFANTSNKE